MEEFYQDPALIQGFLTESEELLQAVDQDLVELEASPEPLHTSLAQLPLPTFHAEEFHVTPEIVAVGTSTGGPKALQELLLQLPADLPVGMIVVQHMPPGFTAPFAKRLDSLSKVKVREARQGEVIEPGSVYIAPAGLHTTLSRKPNSKATVYLSETPAGTLHKPSVDVMMLSVAETFGRYAMGVIMTGMGSDGLQGMTAIRKSGGITVGQDQATGAVYGMPRCCAESGILQKVVPLQQLAWQILQAVRYRPRG